MARHRIRRGLDLPITGEPQQTIENGPDLKHVAVLADDVIGLKPKMLVAEGDPVKVGQPLFEHRKVPGLLITSPAAGEVKSINRGARRALRSVVIAVKGDDRVEFTATDPRARLIESGLWTAFRERPFSTIPAPDALAPGAIFVTAVDSNPLAPRIDTVLEGREADFSKGLETLTSLTSGKVFLCTAPGSTIKGTGSVQTEEFTGKHPAGTVGLHIHTLWPVNRQRIAWHIGAQDVAAIGKLMSTGELDTTRVVSLAGPQVNSPRLLRTRLGASLDELTAGQLKDGDNRLISGSVLAGRAAGDEVIGFLGRYHQQVTVLREGRERELLGWMSPGANRYSTIPTFLSKLMPSKKYDFSTSTNGSHRLMVPLGMYERVMPLDIMPTFLLRALAMGDLENAEKLGALELDEEDLALCTFVCPGKNEYGPMLRGMLTDIMHGG